MGKSIKKNFIYNLLLNVSKVIFPLITAPYIARILGPEGVGLYNFAIMYVGYFALFPLLGVPTYGVREVAKRRDSLLERRQFVSEIISIQFFLTFLTTIIYIASIVLIPRLDSDILIFLVAGINLYICPFTIDWYYKGMEEFKFITERSLLIKVLSICAIFIFVKTKQDLINYVLIYSISNVANEVWNFVVLLKSGVKPKFTSKGLKKHIKPLMVLFLSSVAISIYTMLDTLMLGFMSNYKEVGYYNNASHISRSLIMAITSLSVVAMPRVSYLFKQGKYDDINSLTAKTISFLGFLAIPLCLSVILISPTFIPLFFGEQFYGAILPLQILGLLIISIGFNNLTGTQILLGMGKDKAFLYTVIAGTIANVILNVILIPKYGAVGTSIASVVAETLVLIFSIVYIYKLTNIRYSEWNDIIKTFLSLWGIVVGFVLAKKICRGWWVVVTFAFLGTSLYLLSQWLLKNSSMAYILNMINKKFHSIDNK